MKSEPDEASIDDALAADKQTVAWTGVRNYQARNFMRDQMQIGDGVLFYHSGCARPGIAGIAQVASNSYGWSDVDNDQWDPDSRLIDHYVRRFSPTTVFLTASGNGGPGYGTLTPPSPATGLDIAASTQMRKESLVGITLPLKVKRLNRIT